MKNHYKIFACIIFSMMIVASSTMRSSNGQNSSNSTNTSNTANAAMSSSSSSSNTPTSSHNSSYKFEHGYPAANTVELAYNNTDLGRAIEAYKFFYPTMGAEAQMQSTVSSVGNNSPNQIGIKLLAGPRHQIFTAQSDTPYSLAVLDLKAVGPMVIELPPGNFIGLVHDHNMRWVLDMGIIGPDKGQGANI